MTYAYELSLRFPEADYDLVSSHLLDLGQATFQEGESGLDHNEDPILINERSLISLFAESEIELQAIETSLKTILPSIQSKLSAITTNFNEAWKEFSQAVIVSDKILIQPSWLEFKNRREIEILLDPGLAFGSGSHETTILCMKKLEKVISDNYIETLLDVGCGSGILSILASKLGVPNITAVDIDELAIVSSNENAEKNNVRNIKFSTSTLEGSKEKYNLIVANIISSVLSTLMKDIKNSLTPNGILMFSGILKEEIKEFKNLHRLNHFEEETMGEWGVVWGQL